jgi:hypothetical protein
MRLAPNLAVTGIALSALFLLTGAVSAFAQERTYKSQTVNVRLVQDNDGTTSAFIMEHGGADEVLIQAFYRTTHAGIPLLLHKEVFTPLAGEYMVGISIPLKLEDIVFIRVKEMSLIRDTELGREAGK